jgi:hypothetical protein
MAVFLFRFLPFHVGYDGAAVFVNFYALQRFEPLLTFWMSLRRPAPTVVHTANLDEIHDFRVRDIYIRVAGAYLSRIT